MTKIISFTLLDVREHHEVEFAKIEPHVHIPMGMFPVRQEEIDKEKPIIVICHIWKISKLTFLELGQTNEISIFCGLAKLGLPKILSSKKWPKIDIFL